MLLLFHECGRFGSLSGRVAGCPPPGPSHRSASHVASMKQTTRTKILKGAPPVRTLEAKRWSQVVSSVSAGKLGDPRLYVCQAPNAFICVSPCGFILGSFWVHFGSILGPFWVHFGSILGPFWVHFGSILGPFWVHFGSILGSIWGPFGVHLGSIWGPFRVHFGSFLVPSCLLSKC